MRQAKVATLVLMFLVAAAMGGCEFTCSSKPKGPAEKIGESIDKAVDEVKADAERGVKVEVKRP